MLHLPGQAVAVSSLLLTRLPLAARVCLGKVGIFFSRKLSFNGRKILSIRGGLVEMEEYVCHLKLQKQNRDCRQTPPAQLHSPHHKKNNKTGQNWMPAIQTALPKAITPLPIR